MFSIYCKKEMDSNLCTFLVTRNNYGFALLIKNGVVISLSIEEIKSFMNTMSKVLDADAIVGIMPMLCEKETLFYFVVVIGSTSVGSIGKTNFQQISNVAFIPFKDSGVPYYTITNTSQQRPMNTISAEDTTLNEVYKLITCGTFYYATNNFASTERFEDICTNYQKKTKLSDSAYLFQWNRSMRSYFSRTQDSADNWIIYMICGHIEISMHHMECSVSDIESKHHEPISPEPLTKLNIHNLSNNCYSVKMRTEKFVLAIISRLSWQRMGIRYSCRGLDEDGNVANFVETEQIVYRHGSVSSFIQVRGTIPLFWEQNGIQMLGHKIEFSRAPALGVDAMKRHFKMLQQEYGSPITCLNLVSMVKNSESTLGKTYEDIIWTSKLYGVSIIMFDFHEKCNGKLKTENLSKLFNELNPIIESNSIFVGFQHSDGTITVGKKSQCGVLRTNCIDCIDRTNALQGLIGLQMVEKQLKAMGIFNFRDSLLTELKSILQRMWQKNGNSCSRNYAGTDAMESGKNSFYSKLKDGALSVQRTYKNTFTDSGTSVNSAFSAFKSANQPSLLFSESMKDLSTAFLPHMFRLHYHSSRSIIEKLLARIDDFSVTLQLRIAIGTWNVNSGYKRSNESQFFNSFLIDWLMNSPKIERKYTIDVTCTDIDKYPDILVVGLQEMVDLNAATILSCGAEEVAAWSENILKYISKNTQYVLACAEQLVGVGLIMYIKPSLLPHIKDIKTYIIKTGFGGTTGNKGAICTSFQYHSTRICLVCSHLAAGHTQNIQRNDDFNGIVSQFEAKANRSLFSHDVVFWFGDLNYRIQLNGLHVKQCIKEGDFATLFFADQLRGAKSQGLAFSDFQEATITFNPTYKYDINTDIYDTSEKCRIPAWCDRILWFDKRKKDKVGRIILRTSPLYYGCSEIKSSDHRPVIGIYDVLVEKVNRNQLLNNFKTIIGDECYAEPELSLRTENQISQHSRDIVQKYLYDEIPDCILLRFQDNLINMKLVTGKNVEKYMKNFNTNSYDTLSSLNLRFTPSLDVARKYTEIESVLLEKLIEWASEEVSLPRSDESIASFEKQYCELSRSSTLDYVMNLTSIQPTICSGSSIPELSNQSQLDIPFDKIYDPSLNEIQFAPDTFANISSSDMIFSNSTSFSSENLTRSPFDLVQICQSGPNNPMPLSNFNNAFATMTLNESGNSPNFHPVSPKKSFSQQKPLPMPPSSKKILPPPPPPRSTSFVTAATSSTNPIVVPAVKNNIQTDLFLNQPSHPISRDNPGLSFVKNQSDLFDFSMFNNVEPHSRRPPVPKKSFSLPKRNFSIQAMQRESIPSPTKKSDLCQQQIEESSDSCHIMYNVSQVVAKSQELNDLSSQSPSSHSNLFSQIPQLDENVKMAANSFYNPNNQISNSAYFPSQPNLNSLETQMQYATPSNVSNQFTASNVPNSYIPKPQNTRSDAVNYPQNPFKPFESFQHS